MSVAAAVDIGSNAIRLAVAQVDRSGHIENDSRENYREPVRLGAEVFGQGLLSDDTAGKLVAALRRFRELMDSHGADQRRIVGTSALREAKNQRQVLERVKREAGVDIEVISGAEEARLVRQAVLADLKPELSRMALIDVGGGSVELSLVDDGQVVGSGTYPLGTLRLLEMLGPRRDDPAALRELVNRLVSTAMQDVVKQAPGFEAEGGAGTGGNLEYIGDLRRKLLGKKRNSLIRLAELESICETLASLNPRQRMKQLGMREDRADVILPASLVVKELMERLGLREIKIPGVGLKDGILFDLAQKGRG